MEPRSAEYQTLDFIKAPMSSYSCVIPVNWSLLWEQVLPAWLSVLSGSLKPSEFYAKYVPAGDRYGDLLDDQYEAPADYLSLFPEPLHPPYLRVTLKDSGKCSEFLKNVDWTASQYLLDAAIKQTAAVKLTEDDPYFDEYYGSIDDPSGKKQAAGTKNLYSFLESAFEISWQPEGHYYAYSRKREGASTQLQELLESLFLYQQVLPGTGFASVSPMWPGYDDLSFAGYLSPAQVKSLQSELASWNAASLVEDGLFPLFSNRVKLAAESGHGLLTIHAGL